MLDMSDSIEKFEKGSWLKLVDFVAQIVEALPVSEDGMHIAVVRYAGKDDTNKDLVLNMYDGDDLAAQIRALPYEQISLRPRTRTDLALAACREILTGPK